MPLSPTAMKRPAAAKRKLEEEDAQEEPRDLGFRVGGKAQAITGMAWPHIRTDSTNYMSVIGFNCVIGWSFPKQVP